jgi:threonine synthase
MRVLCRDCGGTADFSLAEWRCPCGGAWEPANQPSFDQNRIKDKDYSIWRYGAFLGLDVLEPIKPMGVGWTPIVPAVLFGKKVVLKLEYLMPTGSFKDRGINTMVNQLACMGAKTMVEDSSGNAGASLAAHGARYGIHTRIFVPEYASPFKQHQISIYGVEMTRVPGTRKDTETAAQAAINQHTAYASHAYQPAYLAGQMTVAFELWEQLGKNVPDWIICPVAQGGQLLGYWLGFSRLFAAGLIDHLPRLIAVQSAQVAPLYEAWSAGLDDVPEIQPAGSTIAEGVSIANPVRGKRLLQTIRESNGLVLAMTDEEILDGQRAIAQKGYYIEPTSALVVAGLKKLADQIPLDVQVALTLTGSGLKGLPRNDRGAGNPTAPSH